MKDLVTNVVIHVKLVPINGLVTLVTISELQLKKDVHVH
jgi:hypothetical protein